MSNNQSVLVASKKKFSNIIRVIFDPKLVVLMFFIIVTASVFINQIVWLQLKNQNIETQNSQQIKIDRQKKDKNKIRDLWQKQAEINDKMIKSGDTVKNKTDILNDEIKKSIRFVFDKAEVLPTANQKNLIKAQEDLNQAQKDLESVNQEAIQFKQDSKNTVDALYQELGEDQFNRANPDGIKQ